MFSTKTEGNLKPLILHLSLILFLGVLVYSNTFTVPFQFDDQTNISENPAVTGRFEPSNLLMPRSVGNLSFMLNWRAGGMDVRGYHVLNLSVHVLNAFLLYFLIILTFKTPSMKGSCEMRVVYMAALFSALLFVSHPVQTQAVTYIVQRLASLSAFFYMGSLSAYISSRLSAGKRARLLLYALSVVFAVLGMKSKETAFTLPLVMLLYETVFFGGGLKGKLPRLLPFFLAMGLIPLGFMLSGRPAGEILGDVSSALSAGEALGRWEYLMTELRVLATYLRLLVLPYGQNIDYDYPLSASLLEPGVLTSLFLHLFLIGLGVYALVLSKRHGSWLRLAAFGIFWFYIALSVESSVIPIADVIFEHRLYLPSAFLIGGFSFCVFYVLRERPRAAVAALTLAVLALSVSAHMRNGVWRGGVSLWEDAARKSPLKFRVHANLAAEYVKNGLFEESSSEIKKALLLKPEEGPELAEAYNILGVAKLKAGRYAEAKESLEKALSLAPLYPPTYNNLASLFGETGDYESALGAARKALELSPSNYTAMNNIGLALASMGRNKEAIEMYEKSIALNPYYAEAHYNLLLALLEGGDTEGALRIYDALKKLSPSLAGGIVVEKGTL